MEEEEGLPACRLGIGEGECVAERGAGGRFLEKQAGS